ncbi:MAG TPA: hypothetical protein VN496_00340 [Burkholderiales bacterium]|nr:hypothetical protein [Burkholderiales bacterium]
MTPRKRWFIIAGLLVSTIVAAAWVHNAPEDEGADIVAVVPDKVASQSASTASRPGTRGENKTPLSARTPQVNVDKLLARDPGALVRDPFAVPAPKIRKPVRGTSAARAPAPAPAAPPMPFTYMGKLHSGPDTSVFLTQGDRSLVVHEGDTIDSIYRVERIADDEITLVYLPLEERQKILIGESQ